VQDAVAARGGNPPADGRHCTVRWPDPLTGPARKRRAVISGSQLRLFDSEGKLTATAWAAQKVNVLVRYQRRSGGRRVVATSPHGWMVTGRRSPRPKALRTLSCAFQRTLPPRTGRE